MQVLDWETVCHKSFVLKPFQQEHGEDGRCWDSPRDFGLNLQELLKLLDAHADCIMTSLEDSWDQLMMKIFHKSLQLFPQIYVQFSRNLGLNVWAPIIKRYRRIRLFEIGWKKCSVLITEWLPKEYNNTSFLVIIIFGANYCTIKL